LLTAIAGQRLVRLIEPSESEASLGVRMPGAVKQDGPMIDSIAVKDLSEKQ